MADIKHGDLSRVISTESDDSYPTLIEITAYWKHAGRRGKVRRMQISADQFFGRGAYGAPMSGEQLIGMIDRLRKR